MFDENGDPKFGYYDIIFWNDRGDPEKVGFYHFQPLVNFFINNTKIQWYKKGGVRSIHQFVRPSICPSVCLSGHK